MDDRCCCLHTVRIYIIFDNIGKERKKKWKRNISIGSFLKAFCLKFVKILFSGSVVFFLSGLDI